MVKLFSLSLENYYYNEGYKANKMTKISLSFVYILMWTPQSYFFIKQQTICL